MKGNSMYRVLCLCLVTSGVLLGVTAMPKRVFAEVPTRCEIIFAGSVDVYELQPVVKELQQLASACGERLTLVIESGGGDVAAGWFFLHDLIELNLHTHIRGNAGSMAVPLFLAGDRRTMSADAELFLHNMLRVFREEMQDAVALRLIAEELDTDDQRYAKYVAERTGQSVEYILELMEGDTSITAGETVRLGFTHAIEEN